MNSKKLYKLAIKRWPSKVNISDGVYQSDDLYVFPKLNSIYEKIESQLENNDHWAEISCWSFQQALWVKSVKNFKEGFKVIIISDVSLNDFQVQIKANLKEDCWEDERVKYNE